MRRQTAPIDSKAPAEPASAERASMPKFVAARARARPMDLDWFIYLTVYIMVIRFFRNPALVLHVEGQPKTQLADNGAGVTQ